MKILLTYLAWSCLYLKRAFASQLGQNIVTNYLTVVWMGGLSLLLIPIYLKFLGPLQWGVVAICMAIQAFMGLLDAGLGQIMPRDIARVASDQAAQARVFRVFSRAYIGLGLIGLVLGQIAVPWLIAHWFNQVQGMSDEVDLALRLVLVQFLFQFANGAHTGYWNGMQTQKLANFRQCAFGTAKHVGALSLVYFWRADALAYLIPFALISALEWWVNRRTVHLNLGEFYKGETSIGDFRILAREAGVLALGVLVGMLVSQIDRIVLSGSVDVASFGRYVIVANLGLAFMQLQYPLMRAFFPRIVRAEASGSGSSLRQLGLGVFLLCVLPCSLVAAVAPWLLRVWLGDPQMVAEGTAPLRLILGAVAVNAMYHLIYQRILAQGQGRIVLLINVAVLMLVTPLAVVAAREYGIVAGGLAWLLGAVLQLGFGVLWMLNRRTRRPE
jgi:O-antigen/teichoic acid export membrane protein